MKKILPIIPMILFIFSANAQVSNDLICNAQDITCGATALGTTVGATTTNETTLPFCTTFGGTSGGVWYRLTGTFQGQSIAANTCNGTNFDTKIHVFSSDDGTCSGNLTCVAGNDDWCSLQSRVTFIATNVAGGNYFIYVHGFDVNVGQFALRVACVKISGKTIICEGKSNTLDAGSGYAAYLWSTNETTQTISVNTANTYSVLVTDVNGSTVSGSTTTTVVPNPVCNITGTFSFCAGKTTEICAPAGLVSYTWNNGAITNCITTGIPGKYSVTITDGNGCTSGCDQLLIMNPLPVCSISGVLDACGASTQLCAVTSTSYSWSSGETSQCIDAITAGAYSVTITDSKGCSSTCGEKVTLNNTPDANAGPDKILDCHITSALLNGSSITPNVSFSWAATGGGNIFSGGFTSTPTIDYTGTYTVTVTNPIGGCTATDFALVTATPAVPCAVCTNGVIIINQNVTINFNTNPPTYSGDPDLLPYFTYDRSGVNASLWKAIFNVGSKKLLIKNGAAIKTSPLSSYTPGIEIKGTCDMEIENGGHIIVVSANKNAGNITIHMNGNIIVNGEIRDEVTGSHGLPGSITIASQCGDINVGQTGLIQSIGEDEGGNEISLLTCGSDCNFYGSGNINISGLVKAFAEGNSGNQDINRPNVKVVSFNGFITVNANSVEPLYDEFSDGGNKYDLYGGILSWISENAKPGRVEVQARLDINVNGHGSDPTGPVHRSFGAIAAVSTSGSTQGGIVDVRSLEGNIVANDRAFDVSGKNTLFPNVASIRLYAESNILLSRPGANNNFNPVVDATSPVSGGKGGTNDIRSYSGKIIIGLNSRVLASVPSGSGSVQGINLLQSCSGVTNLGTITPADLIPGNNSGSCSPINPVALFSDCPAFNIVPLKIAGKKPVDNISSPGINVYPNPSYGKITLNFNSGRSDKYTLQIISITGKIVHNEMVDAIEGINEKEIDLTNLAKGIYILILQSENVKEQKRIIVQ